MTVAADHLREIVQRHVDVEGLGPLARRTGLGIGQIRSICVGRAPLLTTVTQACAALGYELVIRPASAPDSAASEPYSSARETLVSGFSAGKPPPERPSAPLVRVRHRALAELVAAVHEHYEALESEYARAAFVDDVYGLSSALGARRSRASSRGSGGR